MSRLPQPGSDDDIWGDLLNDFLRVEHNTDGSLRADRSLASKITIGGDLAGSPASPLVTAVHLDAPLAITQGGTGASLQLFPIMRGTWAPQTNYKVNDVVQFQTGAFVCLSGHTSSPSVTGQVSAFAADFIAGKWQQLSPRQQWFDVRDYGAKLNNTDDTNAIQAAIDACGAAGGGTVFIPQGTVAVTTIVLKNHVWLRGAGMYATTVRCLSNTNATVIKNYVSPNGVIGNAEFCGVLDLQVDGNKAGNGGATSHGIAFGTNPQYTQATGDNQFDPHHLVQNVRITNCSGVGFYDNGRSECRLINVVAEKNLNGGIATSFDTFLESCTAGNNGVFGFSFSHGDIMANNCKAFLAGRDQATNSPGFSMTGAGLAVTLTGCIAQNNNGDGFFISGVTSIIMSGCAADSNNYGTGNASDAFVGVHINNSSACILDFVSTQGFQSGAQVGNQASALRITGGADINDIRVTTHAHTGFTLGPVYTSDSVLLANRLTANGILLNPLPKLTDDGDIAIANPSDGQTLQYAAASGKWINSSAPIGSFAGGMLGDGSDGATTLDGASAVTWASLAGNVYTMTRDALMTALTINVGITLVCAGYRIFCQGSLLNNGAITANGVNATSATGAAASTPRSLGTGGKGGNGATSAGLGGNQGGVGVGSGGAGGGGVGNSGGAATNALSNLNWMLRSGQSVATGTIGYGGAPVAVSGGAGGSGGGGDGTNKGGGGGTGGSIVAILARSFANSSSGILSAAGGNGFAPTVGNCGGGGGGGGGGVFVFTINPAINNGTTNVSAGLGAAGVGTGTAGASGTNGTALLVQLQ
ncbi:MAG TPA: hypothetical protein VLH38_02030 [Patescibacteria group bacterium]|nr:hypothetical protein [Patescibacteria group bacterium]